ncbi:L-2-hydroxyglutarate oxidase [Cellulomonas chengniuliangii]|uniref:L-2-hydroxyglutarate oxidase n=1 Tax=Cellulomonas chengniuliangii TaxID=2968084 RepID=A0ABY5L3L0_9CELL|nr:L-2-hydroxyglutarate oxidase [Cellulomonas chengniuliangii]MCC2307116.1 L-2-hydroxyglutarate oxidase [Cellulomonas chengniuliangii]UUI76086.1 L-2-hydroxyglutarate oxidase [Cellulomonas chengniuliangii]
MTRVVVVGAGIVGLAVAARLAGRGDEVVVVDKEPDVALHQTGRNSGVIHSGLYYAPGSFKAAMSAAGARSMTAYARSRGIPVQTCGKLVVATEEHELPGLHRLAQRAEANGVDARLVTPAEARDYEPHVRCVGALRVESTGIVDYPGVCRALVEDIEAGGGRVRLGEAVVAIRTSGRRVHVRTDQADREADAVVACAGLHADRLARASGIDPEARIVPFRGEYFELTPGAAGLVRGLVYPVPDPRFPFLGVHLTRMIDGAVHAGPNAVLALAREGYTWSTVSTRDVVDAATWPGMWRLARRNVAPGAAEVLRSLSARAFARSLARLVPAITVADLRLAPAGVRAQAIRRDGTLVDDFLVKSAPRQVHVLNAPSPAATASFEIAHHVVRRLDAVLA